MNAFISEHKVRPLIDRVFGFEQARDAFDYMASGGFIGKIVIRM
jgi:NADPH:quinone reductase-like Zn-dependent oxidoreductase